MNLRIQVRRNQDGVIADYIWENFKIEDFNQSWFKSGNAACDCYRIDFFNLAQGLEKVDIECSNNLFDVRVINDETKEVLYDEFDYKDDD